MRRADLRAAAGVPDQRGEGERPGGGWERVGGGRGHPDVLLGSHHGVGVVTGSGNDGSFFLRLILSTSTRRHSEDAPGGTSAEGARATRPGSRRACALVFSGRVVASECTWSKRRWIRTLR